MTVRHVLLDADGVLQSGPGDWVAAVEPFVGDGAPEFLEQVWRDELPALRGEGDFLVELARAIERRGLDVDPEELHAAVWNDVRVAPQSVELVHRLRAAGYGVHLGSNQERRRATYLRTVLRYDDLFDASCYSCDLGAVKPEPGFFERALELIGAPAGEVLLVDDSLRNVAGARAAGLAAEHWDLTRGTAALESLLATHGVLLDQRSPLTRRPSGRPD